MLKKENEKNKKQHQEILKNYIEFINQLNQEKKTSCKNFFIIIKEKMCIRDSFNIDKKELKNSKRSNNIAFPRQIAMYLCRDISAMSFPQIGNDFGKRDHTTVMHAYTKIEKEIKENPNTKLIVESVKKIILDDN